MQIYENFLSYRRSESLAEVQNIYHALQHRGFSVFCDIYSLDNGRFDKNLLKTIDCCTNYILVLTTKSLDRCLNEDDWLRLEIREALKAKKNIVCVFVGEVIFPDVLPEDIDEIRYYNSIRYDATYFDSFIDNLSSRFLVDVDSSETSNEARDFVINGTILTKYVGYASMVSIPLGVTIIGKEAFKDRTRITSIDIPEGVIEIDEGAFERCININHVSFPETLKCIKRRAFSRCYKLSYIGFNNSLEKIQDEAFMFCTKLRTIRLGDGLAELNPNAFNNCNKLAFFSVSERNTKYSSVDGIIYNRELTELIRCPEGYTGDVINIIPSVITLGPWCFSKCSNIIDVILPRNLERICAYAFSDCHNILSLTLGDCITDFDQTALSGWSRTQRIVVGRKFNPVLKYKIENRFCDQPDFPSIGNDLPKYIMVKTTFEAREEASQIAKMLIGNRLVASVQLNSLNVFYTWNDECCNENEIELSCITRGDLFYQVSEYIRKHHSYECCQIIGIPIDYTSDEFSEWINEQTT